MGSVLPQASSSMVQPDMERERQQAAAAEHEAHQRSIQEWEARVQASELSYPAIPCGPTPAGISSMRALPDVHEALRQNDPRMASHSQPVVKKAPLPLAATPMTPSHPPRPPIEALPQHPSMETSSCANKHPLEPPTAQGPPSKHVRSKAFPYSSQPPDQVFMAASAAVDMPQSSRPCPKVLQQSICQHLQRLCYANRFF